MALILEGMRYNLSSIMSEAHREARITGETMSVCLRRSWMLAKLSEAMTSRIVKFYYEKKNGEVRQAYGRRRADVCPATQGTRSSYPTTFTYFDTEKGEYRCFVKTNLIRIA